MSQENVEVVRQPLAVEADSHRRLEERLGLRFPGARMFLSRAIMRLPSRSRLRRALLRRTARLTLEAANRGDFEAVFSVYYDPAVEATVEPQLVSLGFDPVYRGREVRIGLQEQLVAELDFRFVPEELIDLGDGRVLVVGRIGGSGLSSGAAFDSDWALLVTISAGRVAHERFFFDRAEALEAVGLSE